jgi:hypothetical protein
MASEIEFLGLSAEEAESIAAEWLFERPDLKIVKRFKAIDAGASFSNPDQHWLVKIICDMMDSPRTIKLRRKQIIRLTRAE